MRILLTIHQFMPKHYAGTEVATRDVGLELVRRGHEVHVLTVDPEQGEKSMTLGFEDYEYHGLSVHAIKLPKRRSALEGLVNEYRNDRVAEHVAAYARKLDPDVIHMFHMGWLSAAVIDVFRAMDVPLVFTSTDFWSVCARGILAKPSGELCQGPDDISSNCLECRMAERWFPEQSLGNGAARASWYRRIGEQSLLEEEEEHRNMPLVRAAMARTEFLRGEVNRVDAILAPTAVMKEMLTSNGISDEIVRVSPYGLEMSQFREARSRRRPARELRFGYIGTIREPKGVSVLVKAFRNVPKNKPATLRVVGDLRSVPDYSRKLLRLAGGDERINFTGLIPNEKIAGQLEQIDVLVVPSTWYENAPITIYSALAAGIPVVASNLGGISEVVHDGENGLLFEPGDPEDLARKLKRLLDEPELLDRLRANTEEARSVQDSVNEIESVYRELREERGATGKAGRVAVQGAPERAKQSVNGGSMTEETNGADTAADRAMSIRERLKARLAKDPAPAPAASTPSAPAQQRPGPGAGAQKPRAQRPGQQRPGGGPQQRPGANRPQRPGQQRPGQRPGQQRPGQRPGQQRPGQGPQRQRGPAERRGGGAAARLRGAGRRAYVHEPGPPLFFLTGRAKSGTSWLARMLNFHPEILCKGEGRFLGRDYTLGETGTRSLYGALVHSEEMNGWLANSAWTRNDDLEVELAEISAAITKQVLGKRLADAGKAIVGDKTPLTGPDVVEEIATMFPGTKLIHIIRDGRDVAVSAMHHVWNQDEKDGGFHSATDEQRAKRDAYRANSEKFLAEGNSIFNDGWLEGTATNWADLTRSAMDAGPKLLGDDYIEVRYEDMLQDPEEGMRTLVKFLGADARPPVVKKCVERASFEKMSKGRKPGEEDSKAFVRKGIAGDWKNVFTEEDKRIFKEAAGDLLVRLGHEQDLNW